MYYNFYTSQKRDNLTDSTDNIFGFGVGVYEEPVNASMFCGCFYYVRPLSARYRHSPWRREGTLGR